MDTPTLQRYWPDVIDLIAVDEFGPISIMQLELALHSFLEQEALPVIEW